MIEAIIRFLAALFGLGEPPAPAPKPPPPPAVNPDLPLDIGQKRLFPDFAEAERVWNPERWPNFRPREFACSCCGLYLHDPLALDALQRLRAQVGVGLAITSGTRCQRHNAKVGGAALSMHVPMIQGRGEQMVFACDVSLSGHDWKALYEAGRTQGFNGLGLAKSFLHLDRRAKPAEWDYGPESRRAWAQKGVT